MFKFRPERLDEENLLGRGASGEVFPYQKDPQDQRWVVKRILAKNTDDLLHCLPEVVLGFACDHPCVVPVKGYFVEKVPNSKYFHMYMKIPRMKETLFQNFKDRKRKNIVFTEKEIIQHFYSIVCGIKYLHSKKIYHGDIRHDNLLLDEQGNLKIADVGIAKHVEEEDSYQTVTGQKGTYFYSAPEILGEKAKKEQLSKADIWSLGVVILELCAFDYRLLNSSLPQDKLQSKVIELLQSLEEKYQKGLVGLVKRLLSLDPKERPDIEQIKTELETSFSENLNKDLFDFENSHMRIEDKESELQIALLHQQIQEISKNFEAEKNQFKEIITNLENDKNSLLKETEHQITALTQQIQEISKNFESAKIQFKEIITKLENDKKSLFKGSELRFTTLNQQIQEMSKNFEAEKSQLKEIITKLENGLTQEKFQSEGRIKELQKLLEKEVVQVQVKKEEKKPSKNLEALRRKVKKEEKKPSKNLEALRRKVKKFEIPKPQIKDSLEKVAQELAAKWFPFLVFEAEDRQLFIYDTEVELKDEDMSLMTKDLIEVLEENNLLNLPEIQFCFEKGQQLTDQALFDLTKALCSLVKLEFFGFTFQSNSKINYEGAFFSNSKITYEGVLHLACGIEESCQDLKQLSFVFPECPQITEENKESLKKILARIPKLFIS